MLNNFLFYLRLTWLCFKLFFNLLAFGVSFLFKKLDKELLLETTLLFLILSSMLFDFYLFQKKNNPEISLEKIAVVQNDNQKAIPQRIILRNNDIEEKLSYYQKIDETNIKNLGLFLNLSQLYKIVEKNDLSKEYLDKAQKIEPRIKN